jgi:DNA polymerase-1
MKYLLIDGNNLACRCVFANAELKNSDNISTSLHYGFFNSLIALKQIFPDHHLLVSWDGHSDRRKKESALGVEQGIIKSGYKENRDKENLPQPLKDFHAQAPFLKRAIEQTGIPQIRIPNQETDDIINTYCKKLGKDNEIICMTGDEDFYQLLDDHVSIWNGSKSKMITKEEWTKEYGITPEQHVHVGALTGDTGDNIFGLTGWGEKTALEAIQKYGSWENLYKYYHETYGHLRKQFPDLNPEEFKKLESITTKSGKPKYPEITINSPYTGVTLAVEEKRTGNISKSILMALMFEERVKLAYSLKKMDVIPDLPDIVQGKLNEQKLVEYFDYYDIISLKDSICIFR